MLKFVGLFSWPSFITDSHETDLSFYSHTNKSVYFLVYYLKWHKLSIYISYTRPGFVYWVIISYIQNERISKD